MHILYVSHKNPAREDEGAKIVVMGTLRHLARRGVRVTLASLDQDGAGLDELKGICEKVVAVPHRPPGRLRGLARSLSTGIPYSVLMFRNARFADALRGLSEGGRFDLVHMETALLMQYAGCLNGMPVLLRHHNLEGDLLRQQAAASGGLKGRVYRWQADRLMAFERRAIGQAGRNVAITAADKEMLRGAYGFKGPVDVIPSGIDTGKAAPEGAAEHCLVFSGRVEWGPNAEGVEWFVREVFPEVRKAFPGLRLYIVGGRPGKRLMELSGGPVTVTGFVDSVAAYIDRAEVYIVPLLSGSGMRLKILEAMSRGRAIVSTSKGAEGIACRSGRDIMLADGREAFARAVIGLLSDAEARQRMGKEAFQSVRKNYSWESVAGMFVESYSKAMNAAPVAGQRATV